MASLNEWAYTQEEQDLLDSEADLEQQIVLEEEINGVLQRLKADEVHYDDLVRLKEKIIAQGGLDRATAEEAMLLIKDFNRNKPLNAYPTVATEQYLDTALEEINFTVYAGIGALFIAILAFIAKVFGKGKGEGSGGGSGITAKVQSSAKATEKVVRVVHKLEDPTDFAKELENMMREDIKMLVDGKELIIKSPSDLDEKILPDNILVTPAKHDFNSIKENIGLTRLIKAYWFSKNKLANNFDEIANALDHDTDLLLKQLTYVYDQFVEMESKADEISDELLSTGGAGEQVIDHTKNEYRQNAKDMTEFLSIAATTKDKLEAFLKKLGQPVTDEDTKDSIINRYRNFANEETDEFNAIAKDYAKNPVIFVATMLDTLKNDSSNHSDYAIKAADIAKTTDELVEKIESLIKKSEYVAQQHEVAANKGAVPEEEKLKDRNLQAAIATTKRITNHLQRTLVALVKINAVCNAVLIDYNKSLGFGYSQYAKLTGEFMKVAENKTKFADLANIHKYFTDAVKELKATK